MMNRNFPAAAAAAANVQTSPQTDREEWLGLAIHRACLLEATARKPGNVHPGASFEDLTYVQFVEAAEAIAPILACSERIGVGRAILESVIRCRHLCGSNVNLGIILLIAPLAAVPWHPDHYEQIEIILDGLTVDDSARIYEAIRIANPGGLGKSNTEDVAQPPSLPFRGIMRLAAELDTIAAEYAEGFPRILWEAVPFLEERRNEFRTAWEPVVIHLHLKLMSKYPDSLIARKCGPAVAIESAERARAVLNAGWPDAPKAHALLAELDCWLRADGHRRNPGTTADLVAASLFAAFEEDALLLPDLTTLPNTTTAFSEFHP